MVGWIILILVEVRVFMVGLGWNWVKKFRGFYNGFEMGSVGIRWILNPENIIFEYSHLTKSIICIQIFEKKLVYLHNKTHYILDLIGDFNIY